MTASIRPGRYVAAVLIDRWGFQRLGPWTAETLNAGRPIWVPRAPDERLAYIIRATKKPNHRLRDRRGL